MTTSSLNDQLDRLARLEPCRPFLTLYLNTDVDGTGKHVHDVFVRKALADVLKQHPERSTERDHLAHTRDRIETYLANDLKPSTRGLALFACHAMDLFIPCELRVPFERNEVAVSDRPHVYQLARVCDQYPRCAAVVIDTHTARIFVFSAGETEAYFELQNPKSKHFKAGGTSQARFQRHAENAHLLHVKEVIDRLGTMLQSGVDHLVVVGDEVVVPLFKEQLPEKMAERLVDVIRLDIRASEADIFDATMQAMRRRDEEGDRTLVEQLVGDSRAGGRAVLGLQNTRRALRDGQVETLVIAAMPEHVPGNQTADELVAAARQTSASVHFVEDPMLMQPVGGVAARLRFIA